jgi:hypothetical protein
VGILVADVEFSSQVNCYKKKAYVVFINCYCSIEHVCCFSGGWVRRVESAKVNSEKTCITFFMNYAI